MSSRSPAGRKKPVLVTDVAVVLKHDPTAVRRDVNILTLFGLVRAPEEVSPGGIVETLASNYELVATIYLAP